MNRIVTRGLGAGRTIITRGYGIGAILRRLREVLMLTSKVARDMLLVSKWRH